MEIVRLPFNAHVGIRPCEDARYLLQLEDDDHLRNHLGTLHASALFALAEASSGEFLTKHRGERDDIAGVVRRATCKYSRPASGTIRASSPTDPTAIRETVACVDEKGRGLVPIEILLHDANDTLVARFAFDWFLGRVDALRS